MATARQKAASRANLAKARAARSKSTVLTEARRTGKQSANALKVQRRSQARWDAWTAKGR